MRKLDQDIESNADIYLARLSRAVAQPSISTQGDGLIEMADLLDDMLRTVGFQVERVSTDGAPVILSEAQIAEVVEAFSGYGPGK